MDIYRIAVPLETFKLVMGGYRHIYILDFCTLSCCSTLRIIFTGLLPTFSSSFYTVSRGLTLEFAFLEDVDIGITAYCLPEDKTISEFG